MSLWCFLLPARRGWVVGLEPTTFGTTIRRANQLHHTHHNEPGGIRTLDLRLRRPLLYPAELQTHKWNSPHALCRLPSYIINICKRAGDGNRTHVSSLEGWCSTIELHPHVKSGWQDSNLRPPGPKPGALAKLSHTPQHQNHTSHPWRKTYYIVSRAHCQQKFYRIFVIVFTCGYYSPTLYRHVQKQPRINAWMNM